MLSIWLIFPAFGCFIVDRRGNGNVGLFAGSFFFYCFLPCPAEDPDASWPAAEHGDEKGPHYARYRTCDNDKMFHSCCCNVIHGPYPDMENWTICNTEIRLIPC